MTHEGKGILKTLPLEILMKHYIVHLLYTLDPKIHTVLSWENEWELYNFWLLE